MVPKFSVYPPHFAGLKLGLRMRDFRNFCVPTTAKQQEREIYLPTIRHLGRAFGTCMLLLLTTDRKSHMVSPRHPPPPQIYLEWRSRSNFIGLFLRKGAS